MTSPIKRILYTNSGSASFGEDPGAESLKAGRKITLGGVLVNALLIFFKLFAGKFGHSQALVADAIHSASDLFTDAVVWFGLGMGRKAPDAEHHFGHARIETLASSIVGIALIATAAFVGIEAGWNIYRHAEYQPTGVALAAAVLSILAKEALYRYTARVGRRIKSAAILANAWHHRSDVFSSVAVLVGVAASLLKPGWHILDAYAALLVSFFIIKVGIDILRNTLGEFTDRAPRPEVLHAMRECASKVDGVMDVHDLRARSSGGLYQVEIHILVNGGLTVLEGHDIAKGVENCLLETIENIAKVIVHVDPAAGENDAV